MYVMRLACVCKRTCEHVRMMRGPCRIGAVNSSSPEPDKIFPSVVCVCFTITFLVPQPTGNLA